MSKFTQKVSAIALSIATTVTMIGPVSAHAQSTADLQAMIASLLAQIQTLQAQLNAQTGGTGTVPAYNYTRDLTVGSTGADVSALQQALIASGHLKITAPTGYFGTLTRTALAAWQATNGVSPAAGYFGPLTRARFNSMAGPSVPGVPTVPMTGTVTVTSGTNVGGSIISGASQVPVLNFRITNGTGSEVWVTGARFTKTGVVSDANISNAYLATGNTIVAQYMSLTGGVVTFSGNLLRVPAGQAVDVSLRMDISSGTANGNTVGNTVGFALMSAADLMLSSGSPMGSFPISGGQFVTTSVSNPSLAQVSTSTYQGVAGEVDAGTNSFLSSNIMVTIANSPVRLMSVTYTVTGSVNLGTDLRNLVLKADGVEVGRVTAPAVDGKVTFDMTANPAVLNTGSHSLQVFADVLGTPNRNFNLQVLRPFDWVFQDTQYNTFISAGTPGGTSTTVTVRQGVLTVSLASDTPTGNIALGGSNVTLAKFAVRGSGEPVRLRFLDFRLTKTGGDDWSTESEIDEDVRNISLISDDGTQIGSTINTPSSACSTGGATNTFTCSFGTSSSNINYIIPANTTRVFSLRVDLQSTATITSLRGALLAPGSNNLEGQISFQTGTAPGGTIEGSALSISSTPFQVATNSAFSNQTYVGGAYGVKVASFSVSASSAEAINLTNVRLTTSAQVNASSTILRAQNLTVKTGNTTWNYTVPSITASQTYTFQPPFGVVTIPAGGSVVVDVYVDVLTGSTAATFVNPFSFAGASGTGATTNTNQTLSGAPATGQSITVASAGTLSATVDTSNPVAQQIVLGTSNLPLGRFRFTAGPNEDVKITDLTVTVTGSTSTAPAAFSGLTLRNAQGATVGTGTALAGSSGTYTSNFHFSTPIVITKNTTGVFTVYGNVSDFTSSPLAHNKGYTFGIATTTDVTAFGAASNQSVTTSGSFPLTGNTQTTLRTKLTAALTSIGSTSGRVRGASDQVARLTLSVDPAYGAEFKSVAVLLSGQALATNATTSVLVELLDSGNTVIATTSVSVSTTTTSVTATLNPTDDLITAGDSEQYRIRVDSSSFANASNTSDSLSIQILSAGDLLWQTQGESESLGLMAKDVPLTITVSYE